MTKFANTRYQVRASDDEDWKDVVDVNGNFTEPTWFDSYQYRRKPEPEVVKPKWPTLELNHNQLWEASGVTLGESWNSSQSQNAVNYGISHALEAGLVVLPEAVNKPTQIDYKEEATMHRAAFYAALDAFVQRHPNKNLCGGL